MRYNVPALTGDDLAAAFAPQIGSESKVFYSHALAVPVCSVTMAAPASGLFAPGIPAADLGSNGRDLVVRCRNGIPSAAAIVATFAVTFEGDATGTAVATFAIPAGAKDQSFSVPIGLSTDLKGTGGDVAKKIKAINGLNSIVGGSAGGKLEVFRLPNLEDWFPLSCSVELKFGPGARKAVPIPCGSDPSAFTKYGRGGEKTIELTARHFTAADGLWRLNDSPCCVMIESRADERALTERFVFYGVRGSTEDHSVGEGDALVNDVFKGMHEGFCVFV